MTRENQRPSSVLLQNTQLLIDLLFLRPRLPQRICIPSRIRLHSTQMVLDDVTSYDPRRSISQLGLRVNACLCPARAFCICMLNCLCYVCARV
jgi:hypothetical protein